MSNWTDTYNSCGIVVAVFEVVKDPTTSLKATEVEISGTTSDWVSVFMKEV